jgi:aminoglycoside/choline kinase family phosphotransferase
MTQTIHEWLNHQHPDANISALAADASFRSYYRLTVGEKSHIAMDSSKEPESFQRFLEILALFEDNAITVPRLYACDKYNHYALLSDFGKQSAYQGLNENNANDIYRKAICHLSKINRCQSTKPLGHFNQSAIDSELALFLDWFISQWLQITLTAAQKEQLWHEFSHFHTVFAQQPQVLCHRDYHSKNLMLLDNGDIGVLDFQDALWGPISYDLVSLLRDCYIDWEESQVQSWVKLYYEQMQDVCNNLSLAAFQRCFDLTGLQRHLKALFIFARKHLRDNDPRYLKYIPRTLHYACLIASRYQTLFPSLAVLLSGPVKQTIISQLDKMKKAL